MSTKTRQKVPKQELQLKAVLAGVHKMTLTLRYANKKLILACISATFEMKERGNSPLKKLNRETENTSIEQHCASKIQTIVDCRDQSSHYFPTNYCCGN